MIPKKLKITNLHVDENNFFMACAMLPIDHPRVFGYYASMACSTLNE